MRHSVKFFLNTRRHDDYTHAFTLKHVEYQVHHILAHIINNPHEAIYIQHSLPQSRTVVVIGSEDE